MARFGREHGRRVPIAVNSAPDMSDEQIYDATLLEQGVKGRCRCAEVKSEAKLLPPGVDRNNGACKKSYL